MGLPLTPYWALPPGHVLYIRLPPLALQEHREVGAAAIFQTRKLTLEKLCHLPRGPLLVRGRPRVSARFHLSPQPVFLGTLPKERGRLRAAGVEGKEV